MKKMNKVLMLLGSYKSVKKAYDCEVVYAHNPYNNTLRYCGLAKEKLAKLDMQDISIFNIISEIKESVIFGKYNAETIDEHGKTVYEVFNDHNIIDGKIGNENHITLYDFKELGFKNIQEMRYTDDDLFAYIIEVDTHMDEDLILINQTLTLDTDGTFNLEYNSMNYLNHNSKTGLIDVCDDILHCNFTENILKSLTDHNSIEVQKMVADIKDLFSFRLVSVNELNQDDEDVELLEDSFTALYNLEDFDDSTPLPLDFD